MSTILRNPRTFQNRNRTITKVQELLHGSRHGRGQHKELIAQQDLIVKEQARKIQEKRAMQANHGLKEDKEDPEIFMEDSGAMPHGMNGMNEMNGSMNGLAHGMNGTMAHGMPDMDEEAPKTMKSSRNQPQNGQNAQFTIFVSIASYRDPECILTVLDLFQKAEHPERVFVGVYEQNDPETDKSITISHLLEQEPENVPATLKPMASELKHYFDSGNLRPMVTSCVDAKGPMYARALIEKNLFSNEQFYMIIDSHALFEPNWDSICLTEWAKLKHARVEKPVLSYFPLNFDRNKRTKTPLQLNPQLKLDYLKFLQFDKNCGVPMPTEQAYKNMPREPIRALFWTACFSFAASSMLQEVPFDDGYPYLFLGEEICMNLRLFTHGYDVYGPSKHILYHIKNRDYRPTYWELFYAKRLPQNASFTVTDAERHARKAEYDASLSRMSQLLFNHPEHGISEQYALGHERSYKQFCDFIGINFEKQVVKEHTRLGRTNQPSKEEQYAKMVENANQSKNQMMRSMPQKMNLANFTNKQQQSGRQSQKPWMPQPRMTPMTGLTGGGLIPQQSKPKEIPRTRVPRQTGLKAIPGIQQRSGPPRASEYARGMWGKP